MGTNEYGFDFHYMEKRLERMKNGIDRYTPDEAFRGLMNMAMVAADQAKLSVKVTVKPGNKR